MDDRIVLESIRSGNKNAYGILIEKYHHEMFRYAYNLVGNYSEVEDLVQEVFIHVYLQIPKFNASKASFRTWLYRLAHHFIINHVKSKSRQQQTMDLEWNEALDPETETPSVADEARVEAVIAVMKKVLPDRDFQIMSYHYFHDFTIKEIAEIMNLSDKAVYKVIHTSIIKIRKGVQSNGKV